jgi:hypothetical protein
MQKYIQKYLKQKLIIASTVAFFTVSILSTLPVVVFAQRLTNPLQFETLSEFIAALLDAVILLAFPFIVLMFVYAGFLFLTAQGNEQKLKQFKMVLLWTIVGALLVLGARVISDAIQGTVNEIRGALPLINPFV